MKRTSPVTLVLLAAAGAAVGFGLDHLLTVSGRETFSPSPMLPVLLVLLAAGVLITAWPVRRSLTRGTRVDPFRAVGAVTLARASSLLGALAGGFGGGLLVFAMTRQVMPQVGSIAVPVALVAGAAVLVAAALVAEHFCTLPKDPDDRQLDDTDSAEPAG